MAQPGAEVSGAETETAAAARLQQLLGQLQEAGEKSLGLEELGNICAELKEVGSQFPRPEVASGDEAFDRLGQQLEKFPDTQQEDIVMAFAPLRENVRRRMAGVTAELNKWLDQAPRHPATPEKLAELFGSIADAPQMRWYKQCSDLDTKVRFLIAIAAAIRATEEHPMLRGFVGSHPPAAALAQRLASSFFTLPEFGNILSAWLDARLEIYNEAWQRAAEQAVVKCKDKLQDRLSAALDKATSGRSIQYIKIAEWPMNRCPLAREFINFTVQNQDILGDDGMPTLAECPPHSLRPHTLLHLFRLLEVFEVDAKVMPLGSVQKKTEPEEVEEEQDDASTAAEMDTEAAAAEVQADAAQAAPAEAAASNQAPALPTQVAAPAPPAAPAAQESSAPAPSPSESPSGAEGDDNLSVAVPPGVRPAAETTAATAAVDAKAKKAQMLGFEAPVKAAKGQKDKRSLVGGAVSLSMAPAGGALVSAAATTDTGAQLVRRKIDWKNLQYLERVVRRGLRPDVDAEWTQQWAEHCKEQALPADFSVPIPTKMVTVFFERNVYELLRKDWAKDLMWKEEGQADECPPSPTREPNPSEEPAKEVEAEGAAEAPKEDDAENKKEGSKSRDGSSSSSSSGSKSGEKKKKKRKAGKEEVSDKDRVLEQLNGRIPPLDYKIRMCHLFLDGKCFLGKDCIAAHAEGELMASGEAARRMQAMADFKKQKDGQDKKEQQKEEPNKEEPDMKKQRRDKPKPQRVNPNDPYYKTQPCHLFAKNQCPVPSNQCFFAHSQEELRMNPEAMMRMQQMGMNPMMMQQMGMNPMMMGMPPGMMPPGMPPGMMPPGMSHPGQMPMQPPPGGQADGKKKEKKRDDKDKEDKAKKKKDKKEDKERDKDKDKRKDRDKEKDKDKDKDREKEKEKDRGKEKKEKSGKEKDRGKDSKAKPSKDDKQPKKKEKVIDDFDV